MTDELETSAEGTPPEEVHEEKPRPKDLPEDQEWERVDFQTADRELIERRFNRVYGSMKMTENALKEAAEYNRKITERLEAIERETQENKTNTRLQELKAEKVKALEEGDNQRAVEIDDQILDLKTPKPKPEEKKPEPKKSEWFTPDKEEKLLQWAGEVGQDGQPKRPWAQPGHPKNARAVEIINGVLNDPDFNSMDEILAEVDRLMMPAQRQRQGAVLTGDGEPRKPKKDTVTLNEEQKLVARRMYPQLSAKEAHERYSKALKRVS